MRFEAHLGKLPRFRGQSPVVASGQPEAGSELPQRSCPRRFAPPLLPMLRRASPLAQYRRARPAAAMTIRHATTGLNGTNAPMTVPTAPVRALLIGGPRLRLDRR